jgi:predicted nucleotidyltransferase
VVRVGYFGSYARGDWGPGSDLDLVIVVRDSSEPPHRRSLAFDATDLPVPADVLVYTVREWQALEAPPPGRRSIAPEVVWVYREPPGRGS